MASLDEISRAIGSLEARAAGMEKAVSDLVEEIRRDRAATGDRLEAVERWQAARDGERRRDRLWLTVGGGAIGSVVTYLAPGLAKKLGFN